MREGRCLPEQATIRFCFQAYLETNRGFFENPFPHFRVSRILTGRVTGIVLTVLQNAFAQRSKNACVGHLAGWQQCLNPVSLSPALGIDSSFPSAPEPEGAQLCLPPGTQQHTRCHGNPDTLQAHLPILLTGMLTLVVEPDLGK